MQNGALWSKKLLHEKDLQDRGSARTPSYGKLLILKGKKKAVKRVNLPKKYDNP